MSIDELIQAFDVAIQTREAADTTGWTNKSPSEARRAVEVARKALRVKIEDELDAAFARGQVSGASSFDGSHPS